MQYIYITMFFANAAIHKSESSRNLNCEVKWYKFDVNKRFLIILRSLHHNSFFVLINVLLNSRIVLKTDMKTHGLHLTWGPGMTESHIQYRHPCISIDITVRIRTQ